MPWPCPRALGREIGSCRDRSNLRNYRHTNEIQARDSTGQPSLVVCLSFRDGSAHEFDDIEEPTTTAVPDLGEGCCEAHLAVRERHSLIKPDPHPSGRFQTEFEGVYTASLGGLVRR